MLKTDSAHEGHGLSSTIGRGNEVVSAAIRALASRVKGLDHDWVHDDPGRFWHHLTGDSQLRWIGPDKGAIHLATAAIVNAIWDLLAKQAGNPAGDSSPIDAAGTAEDCRLPLSHGCADAR